MAIATGDLLQITDFQTYLGEECLNVYYYRWFSAPTFDNSAYAPLLADFNAVVIAPVIDIQHYLLLHDRLEIRNLSNNLDFAALITNVAGTRGTSDAQAMPSFNSAGFQLVRDSLIVRNGYKRYAGLSDDLMAGNNYSPGASEIADVITGLTSFLQIGLIDVAAPVIVKRPIDPPLLTYDYASVVSALYKGAGTQNTRKP